MRQGSSARRARASRSSALVDAIAPVTAALLVPVLVGFALEVPADAIDRIASPFVGQARAAVVTRKTEDDGLQRRWRLPLAAEQTLDGSDTNRNLCELVRLVLP